MAYTPNVWKDGPEGRTPITASALTKIENGLAAAASVADTANSKAAVAAPAATVTAIQQQVAQIQAMMKFIIPIGGVIPFYGADQADGWLVCNGQAVSRTTYAELFAVLGTRAGAGDGRTTFNVPDIRGQVIYGYGYNGRTMTLGATVGEFQHTISKSEMPPHSHEIGEKSNPNSRFQARTANQDIGIGSSGYTYLTSTGLNASDRSPVAVESGSQSPMQVFPRGSVANYIMRAK
jgi:microcystin-dependent protein|nr:MAG TPA: tail collar fiber protein [Caudoviricetes sp.]